MGNIKVYSLKELLRKRKIMTTELREISGLGRTSISLMKNGRKKISKRFAHISAKHLNARPIFREGVFCGYVLQEDLDRKDL